MKNIAKKKCRVISITNQKGGVGKTAVAVNLATCLARKGYKVLLIDNDGQGDSTASLGFRDPDDMDDTLKDVYEKVINDDEFSFDYGIRKVEEGFYLLPGNIELAGVEFTLVNVMNRERILRQYVSKVRDQYDFIFIDCGPSLGMLSINAWSASDSVIIPVKPSYLPVKGLQQLFKSIYQVKKQINPELQIEGVLMNLVDNRKNFAKDIVSMVHEAYGNQIYIFNTYVPESVKLEEATAEGISVLEYSPKNKTSLAFRKVAEEVLRNE